MINAIASFVGCCLALYTLANLFVGTFPLDAVGDAEFGILTILLALSALTLGVAILGRMTCLVLLVLLTRGRFALEWSRPSECASGSWLTCSWNFVGRNGRQEGLRFFGLGIALQGDHDKNPINALDTATQ